MAVIITNKSYKVSIKTNAGTDSSGNVITETVGLGSLKNGADQDKIVAVAGLVETVLENPIYSIEETTVNILSE